MTYRSGLAKFSYIASHPCRRNITAGSQQCITRQYSGRVQWFDIGLETDTKSKNK